jgi:hypothetical protein
VLISVFNVQGGRRGGPHLERVKIELFDDTDPASIFFTTWSLAESQSESHLRREGSLALCLAPFMWSASRSQSELLVIARARLRKLDLADEVRSTLLHFLRDR